MRASLLLSLDSCGIHIDRTRKPRDAATAAVALTHAHTRARAHTHTHTHNGRCALTNKSILHPVYQLLTIVSPIPKP
jgi:hypothetical protein